MKYSIENVCGPSTKSIKMVVKIKNNGVNPERQRGKGIGRCNMSSIVWTLKSRWTEKATD